MLITKLHSVHNFRVPCGSITILRVTMFLFFSRLGITYFWMKWILKLVIRDIQNYTIAFTKLIFFIEGLINSTELISAFKKDFRKNIIRVTFFFLLHPFSTQSVRLIPLPHTKRRCKTIIIKSLATHFWIL